MYFRYFVIISPWKRAGHFIWKKLESPWPKDALCQVWLKLVQWFWRRRFLNFVNVFSLFRNYLPLEKGGPFICSNLNPLQPRMLCAKSGWNWLSGSGEEVFLISSMYFHYFQIIFPWKRAGPFIWIKLNPLHPRMLCAKFGWNWPSGSGEEDNVFQLFRNYLPLEKGGLFIWTNLNPLHTRMLCAKFGWNWPSGSGEDFLISSMFFPPLFRTYVIISPWKRAGPSFEQTWFPFT